MWLCPTVSPLLQADPQVVELPGSEPLPQFQAPLLLPELLSCLAGSVGTARQGLLWGSGKHATDRASSASAAKTGTSEA